MYIRPPSCPSRRAPHRSHRSTNTVFNLIVVPLRFLCVLVFSRRPPAEQLSARSWPISLVFLSPLSTLTHTHTLSLFLSASFPTLSWTTALQSLPGQRKCHSLRRSPTWPLPTDSPHNLSLRLPNSNSILSHRNCNHTRNILSKNNSRSLSTHGLHITSHLNSRDHRFFEILMCFLWLPPPPENCFSLEVMQQHHTSISHQFLVIVRPGHVSIGNIIWFAGTRRSRHDGGWTLDG